MTNQLLGVQAVAIVGAVLTAVLVFGAWLESVGRDGLLVIEGTRE